MHIQCTTPEQLDEVITYYKIPILDSMFILNTLWGFTYVDIENKNFTSRCEHNYITYYQWKLDNTYKSIMDKIEKSTTRKQVEILEEELLDSFKERDMAMYKFYNQKGDPPP